MTIILLGNDPLQATPIMYCINYIQYQNIIQLENLDNYGLLFFDKLNWEQGKIWSRSYIKVMLAVYAPKLPTPLDYFGLLTLMQRTHDKVYSFQTNHCHLRKVGGLLNITQKIYQEHSDIHHIIVILDIKHLQIFEEYIWHPLKLKDNTGMQYLKYNQEIYQIELLHQNLNNQLISVILHPKQVAQKYKQQKLNIHSVPIK